MVVKIVKTKLKYNKLETTPKNPENDTQPTHKPSIAALHGVPFAPFIDSMSIVVKVANDADQQSFYKSLHTELGNKEILLDNVRKLGWRFPRRLVLTNAMKTENFPILSWRVTAPTHDPSKAPEHDADGKNYNKHGQLIAGGRVREICLDLWPRAMTVGDFDLMYANLTCFVHQGFRYFHDHGKITKIEVSTDLANLKMAEIHVVPDITTTAKTWSKEGQIETIVLGKTNVGNSTRIYDRGKKRLDKGQVHPIYEGVRVERILRPKGLTLPTLAQLKNPFAGLAIVTLPSKPITEPKDYIWEMFTDTVKLRGLPAALKLLPEEKRAEYRKWFKSHGHPKWDATEIWNKWGAYLMYSGLFSKKQHTANALAAYLVKKTKLEKP